MSDNLNKMLKIERELGVVYELPTEAAQADAIRELRQGLQLCAKYFRDSSRLMDAYKAIVNPKLFGSLSLHPAKTQVNASQEDQGS